MPLPLLVAPRRSPLTRLTVALTLLLGAALAWAVVAELRFQRRTTERIGEDYVALLARERVDAASAALAASLRAALGAQLGGTMGSVYDVLPPPGPVGDAPNPLGCPDTRDAGYFRIDLRDRSVLTTPTNGDVLARAVQAARAHMQNAGPLAAAQYRALSTGDGVVVYGVKYAPYQAPVAVYGALTCPNTIASIVSRAHASAPDSVVSLVAAIGADTLVGRGGSAARSRRSLASGEVAGIALTAYLAADRLPGIIVARTVVPPSILTMMLVGTAALALIAVVQLVRDRRAVRRQAELVMTISHELRTPLAQILLYSETLALDRVRGEEAKRAAAQRIVDETRHLVDIVSNVVAFARGEPARGAVTTVRPVIDAAIARLRAAGRDGADVAIAVPDELVVSLSNSALFQVLTNVLDNAFKFGAVNQTVRISAVRAARQDGAAMIHLVVEDEGPGIPAAERPHVWSKYYRGNGTAGAAGAGIGLWIVQDLVTRAGGTVRVDDGLAGGTRVVIELPAAEGGDA